MNLDHPVEVASALRAASADLSEAHRWAAEDNGLIGPVRDMLFGLNSTIEALAQEIEEGG